MQDFSEKENTLLESTLKESVFLKGNTSSSQHRWSEVLSPRKAARWQKGPFQLQTAMTSLFYERWVWCWKAYMEIRRQIHKTPVSLWKGHSKQSPHTQKQGENQSCDDCISNSAFVTVSKRHEHYWMFLYVWYLWWLCSSLNCISCAFCLCLCFCLMQLAECPDLIWAE